ncbi:hypothetical protein [Pseudomarimonas salicorniae]|uniref:WD40-like Beta Propeller Repeat n=1 Tax=Pseudomarimonas salicorniae TaxID=2933270 RepID=A0ABT0GLE4_9GAMM|nr:hypothetical protein [Lysobacter sp. CAU 1642]MCK7595359.1 hypothetical protein [Lysobacter sp. CAU 1642]
MGGVWRRRLLGVALAGLACNAPAQVPVSEVEQFYANSGVFSAVEPSAHAHATRFPSLSADGVRIAFARDGEGQLVIRDLSQSSSEVVPAPGLRSSGRDFTLSSDGRVLAFDSEAVPGKAGCNRVLNLRNALTGTQTSVGGAACLDRPSKPIIAQFGKPYGFASNILRSGAPSPSNSYDIYFRRVPPFLGKGDSTECLSCAQDDSDSGSLGVGAFSAEPVSNVAHRENKDLWISNGGSRLSFVYSIAYERCEMGNPDCGESGLVIADASDAGITVRRSLRLAERNRFLEAEAAADGNRFVFSTSAPMVPGEDADDDLDVYLYDVIEDRVILLSGGLTGSANDVRISGNGRFAIFTRESIPRRIPIPPDVQGTACGLVFDPVDNTSEYYLVDLQGETPRRARVLGESRQFGNDCEARTATPRQGADINHSGTRIALTTRNALDAGDTNNQLDVYVAPNHFARDLIFDHSFD